MRRIETKPHAISDYKDPFLYRAKKEVHTIEGHIGNNKKVVRQLEKFIFNNAHTYFVSPTGSGKTTFIFSDLIPLIATDESPVIISVPTQALADQVAEVHNIPCIREGAGKFDLMACEHSKAIVCTYDSLPRLKGFIPSCAALVFDEAHHLVSDCSRGFKFEQINKAFELSREAQRVVLMSATPHEFFDRIGFKFIELKQKDTTPFQIAPVWCNGKPEFSLLSHLEQKKDAEGIEVVFMDDKTKLGAIRRHLLKSGLAKDSEIALMHGKNKKGSETYDSIIKLGRIPEGIKYVLTTRLLADGVSIYNEDISGIHMLDVKNEEIFVQFPARFRKLKSHLVYSYRIEKDKEWGHLDSVESDLSGRYQVARIIKDNIHRYAKDFGTETSLNTKYRSNGKSDPFNHIFLHDGKYSISDLHIFHSHVIHRDYETGATQFYKRLWLKYEHVSLIEAKSYSLESAANITASIKADKRKEKEVKSQMYRKLKHDPQAVLTAVYNETGSEQMKDTISQVVNVQDHQEEAEAFKERNEEIFEYRTFEPAKQWCKLYQFGLNPDAIDKVLEKDTIKTRVGFARFESMLHVQSILGLSGLKVSSMDMANIDRLKAVKEAFKKYCTHLGKGEGKHVPMNQRLTKDEISNMIKSALGFDVGRKSLKVLKEIFIVHEGRFGTECAKSKKGGRFYYLESSQTLREVLSYLGMTIEEFEANVENRNSLIINKVSKTKHNILNTLNLTPTLPSEKPTQNVCAWVSNNPNSSDYVPF